MSNFRFISEIKNRFENRHLTNRYIKKSIVLTSVLLLSLILYACSPNENNDSNLPIDTIPDIIETNEPYDPPDVSGDKQPPSPTLETTEPSSQSDISAVIEKAVKAFVPSVSFDMSNMNLSKDEVQMTIQNAYFDVLSNDPSLKYAYSITIQYDDRSQMALCQLNYMPYKTGEVNPNNIPEGAYVISTYQDLIKVTNQLTGQKSAQIAIINPELDYEIMQKVLLSQCGYGYIIYSFNDDATKLLASAPIGMTLEQCVDRIEKADEYAENILKSIITTGMSDEEKIKSVYDYVTSTVVYDPEFKGSTSDVSIDSTTAYGAFKNKTAICGGYANAVYLLLSHLNIPCYNVTGKGQGVDHMWNVIQYNDTFLYFDATWDAGVDSNYYVYFAKTQDYFETFSHIWDTNMIDALTK